MYLMSAAWGSLAIVLSLLGAAYGWLAWQRQGLRGAVRGAGLVLLPLGLWLTGTLRLVGFLIDWFAGWATGLVLSPSVIVGSVMVVAAVLLLGLASRMTARAAVAREPAAAAVPAGRAPARAGAAKPAARDDEMDEIEALLRKRGIQ